MSEAVTIERRGPVVVWTIQRPEARNAINEDVVAGLENALQSARLDTDVHAAVLTGAGERAFISGADLKLLASETPRAGGSDRLRSFNTRMAGVTRSIARLPIPVIAAINGRVLGGGCEIAAACDMRIVDELASFTFKHAAMGVTPGWGGFDRLTSLIPRGVAAKLLFSAQPMGAREAATYGLADEVTPKGEALQRAVEIAGHIAQVSPSAVADMKRLLIEAYATPAAKSESEVFARRAVAADHRDAVRAYTAGDSPNYSPRITDLLEP